MSDQETYGFNTQQIHAGNVPDPATGALNTPIYQSAAFAFRNVEHAADLFALREMGPIYSRINNPTNAVLQERLAALEGGIGGVVCSSGNAAQLLSIYPLMSPGKKIVASTRLYGGTVTQLTKMINRFGWKSTFVDFEDLNALEAAIDEDTRAIWCESIANPEGYITDLEAIGKIANKAGVPLIVDNTTATPYLCRPIDFGATIVVGSTTKYLTGNGSVMGGYVVDSGAFNWSASDKFPSLSQPESAYNGITFHEIFGPMAYTVHSIAVGLRDLGMCMNPQAAHYTLMALETLSLRMKEHCKNATIVAEWLEGHDNVTEVTYPGLKSSPYYERAMRITPNGCSSLFSIKLKGGYEACIKFVDRLKLFSHVANLGDAKSLVLHPASTTHSQLSPEQRLAAGVEPDAIRLSVGIEDANDLIGDLKQALEF